MRSWILTSLTLAVVTAGCSTSQPQQKPSDSAPAPAAQAEKPAAPEAAKPQSGSEWEELLNTDAAEFGGSGVGNFGTVHATDTPYAGRPASVELTLPPLAGLWLRPKR